MDMKLMKIKDILIYLDNQFNDSEIKKIIEITEKSICKVLPLNCEKLFVKSIVISKSRPNSQFIVNGVFHKKEQKIEVCFLGMDEYKLHTVLCHELAHARFLMDVLTRGDEKIRSSIINVSVTPMFLIEEYMVLRNTYFICKNEEELNGFLKEENWYYNNKKLLNSQKPNDIIQIYGFLANLIIARRFIKHNYGEDKNIKKLAKELELIFDIPTFEQYNNVLNTIECMKIE